jgi:hypothetical protein
VVTTPTDSAMKSSTQIESIVNSLNLAVNGNHVHEWEMLVLPSTTELLRTTVLSEIPESKTQPTTGSILKLPDFADSESSKTIFLERNRQGFIFLICSEGTVFAPNTVSELLSTLDESNDIFSTQNYPVNVGIGLQPVTSVLLGSECSNKAFIELFESNSAESPISRIISQLSNKFFASSSNVPAAKSFDTKYSFGESSIEYV